MTSPFNATPPPGGRPLRILLVEDNHEHAGLASTWLREDGDGRFDVVWVERLSAALAELAASPVDAILLDLSLPDSDRLDTFRAVRGAAASIPIVLMTGIGDERLAMQAMHEGAQDYLIKGDTDGRLLVRALRYAIERGRADAAERRLLEGQRLESLAVMAGGIAHQLNNLLVVIIGNASLASAGLTAADPARLYLEEIESASQQAARLARQMLAYSGRGGFIVRPIDINEVVRNACAALDGSVPTPVSLELALDVQLPPVRADETQVAQVVLNLLSNAIEAVGDRPGTVRVTTALAHAEADDFARSYLSPQLPPGEYVELLVTDDGEGMPPEVATRAFEPFFSTRLTGRGLGLPAALGIVRGHAGAIAVDSAPRSGTRVRVLLPAAPPAP